MKLSIISDEVSQDLGVAIEFATGHGLHGLEIRSVWNKSPLDLSRGECQEVAARVSDAGLSVPCFDSPAFKTAIPMDARSMATARADFERAIERSVWLGADHVRVFSFYRRDDGCASLETIAAMMGQLLGAQRPPVPVLIENGMRTNTPSSDALRQLLNALGHDWVGALWDPGNSVFSGFEPVPYPGGYGALRDRIRHVHVKDPRRPEGYTRLGDGEVPWRAIVRALRDDGYVGFLSLETHWRHDRVLTAAERDVPHGEGFSRGGYGPSSECAAVLAALAS